MAIILPELAPGGDDAGALEETKGEGPDRPPALALRSGIDDGHFAFGTDGLAQDPDIDPLRRHRWRADQEGGWLRVPHADRPAAPRRSWRGRSGRRRRAAGLA